MPRIPATELPEALIEWIRAGKPVRQETEGDQYAGRCGARVQQGGRGLGVYCRKAAGSGTTHLGVGPCHHHPLETRGDTSLAPWVGEVDPQQWRAITGHNASAPGGGGFPTKHGATEALTMGEQAAKTLTQHFEDALTDEDRAVYRSIDTSNPVALLDEVIRTQVLGLYRINKSISDTRRAYALAQKPCPAQATAASEAIATRIAQTVARLEEARFKFIELDRKEDALEGLADLLSGLSDEDFARISANPQLLTGLKAGAVLGGM